MLTRAGGYLQDIDFSIGSFVPGWIMSYGSCLSEKALCRFRTKPCERLLATGRQVPVLSRRLAKAKSIQGGL
eukprot:s7111_g1.t1